MSDTLAPRHKVKCPHPECEATIRVPDYLQGGDYPCLCKAKQLRLRWATYLDRGRVPSLSLAENEQ